MNEYILRILFIAFVATSLMTLFSYGYSAVRKKQFKEPELLNKLMLRLRILRKNAASTHPAGWVLHYLVGIMFVTVYMILFHKAKLLPGFGTYVVLGMIYGVFGISVWKLTFNLHPNPPKIHFKEFYLQLLLAHVVFGLGAYLGDALLGATT